VDRFWELFAESVIIQAVLALLFGVTVCAMYLRGQAVPTELVALLSAIIGYYFGAKTQIAARRTADHIRAATAVGGAT
jgi:hypothetical protein